MWGSGGVGNLAVGVVAPALDRARVSECAVMAPCESHRSEAERGWYAQRKGFDFPMLLAQAHAIADELERSEQSLLARSIAELVALLEAGPVLEDG